MSNESREPVSGPGEDHAGLSRRGFLSSVGSGALTVAAVAQAAAQAPPASEIVEGAELTKVALHVNGRRHEVLVEPRWSLAFVLRERLGLTGTKIGCDRGECGACTVLIDDRPHYACLTLAVEAEGRTITTVEGLMDGEELGATQQAFLEHDAFQCGYCTPGQIMAAEALVRTNAAGSLEEVRRGMSGNLCRCGAYAHIFRAVQRAAELRHGTGGAS